MTALVFLTAFLLLVIPLCWIALWMWLSERSDRKYLARQELRQNPSKAEAHLEGSKL